MTNPVMPDYQYDAWVDFLAQAAISNGAEQTYQEGYTIFGRWFAEERNRLREAVDG